TSITTTTDPTTSLPIIPNFSSLFKFESRVSNLERDMSELKQTNQYTTTFLSIPGIFDAYLATKMQEAVNVAIQLQTNQLREEAQADNQDFIDRIDTSM
ncbi:hypothetical protein Tco_0470384, partial [Tanacetum coccineum]